MPLVISRVCHAIPSPVGESQTYHELSHLLNIPLATVHNGVQPLEFLLHRRDLGIPHGTGLYRFNHVAQVQLHRWVIGGVNLCLHRPFSERHLYLRLRADEK